MTKIGFFGHNLHRTTAQHEGRSYEYGITDPFCSFNTRFDIGNGFALGLRNIKIEKNLFELISVFCSVYRIAVGSEYLNIIFFE